MSNLSKHERQVLHEASLIIRNELAAGRSVRIPEFGKFEVKEMETWTGFNSGSPVTKTVPKFKPFQAFKDAVVSIKPGHRPFGR